MESGHWLRKIANPLWIKQEKTLASCKEQHTLWSGPGPWSSEKADSGPLEKVDLMIKVHWMSQSPIFDKFEGAYFKYDDSIY